MCTQTTEAAVCRAVELQVGRRLTAVQLAQMCVVLPAVVSLQRGRFRKSPRTVHLAPGAVTDPLTRGSFKTQLRRRLAVGQHAEAALDATCAGGEEEEEDAHCRLDPAESEAEHEEATVHYPTRRTPNHPPHRDLIPQRPRRQFDCALVTLHYLGSL